MWLQKIISYVLIDVMTFILRIYWVENLTRLYANDLYLVDSFKLWMLMAYVRRLLWIKKVLVQSIIALVFSQKLKKIIALATFRDRVSLADNLMKGCHLVTKLIKGLEIVVETKLNSFEYSPYYLVQNTDARQRKISSLALIIKYRLAIDVFDGNNYQP